MRGALAGTAIVGALVLAAPAGAATKQCTGDGISPRYFCRTDLKPGDKIEQILPSSCDRFRDFNAYSVSRDIGTIAERKVPLPSFLLKDDAMDYDADRVDRMRVRVTLSNARHRVTTARSSRSASPSLPAVGRRAGIGRPRQMSGGSNPPGIDLSGRASYSGRPFLAF